MKTAYPSLTEEFEDGDAIVHTITYRKSAKEMYVFRFTKEFRAEILRTLGRFASNPELDFSWDDAGKVSQCVPTEPREINDILSERAAIAKLKRE